MQHFALLIGYGCAVVNPYLAFETIEGMIHEGLVTSVDTKLACKNYVKAATKGVVKVMSKMGISAVQSYHGAQVFEAVGLRQDVIDQYFTWTASRIGGVGMDVIAQEVLMRHRAAFPARQTQRPHAADRRPVSVARGLARRISSIRSLFIACRRRCAPTTTRSTSLTRSSSTISRRTSSRCAGCWSSRLRSPFRWTKWSPSTAS